MGITKIALQSVPLCAHFALVVYILAQIMWDSTSRIGTSAMAQAFVDDNPSESPLYLVHTTNQSLRTSYQRSSWRLDHCVETHNSSYLLQCVDTGLFDVVRYDLPSSSLVLGSSLNVFYIILVFEWISTGFALFYIAPASGTLHDRIARIVASWNIILVILTAILYTTDSWNVPANNCIFGIGSLLVASAIQMIIGVLGLGEFTYRLVSRYCEYAITAPLLMLGTMSVITISAPIWVLQVAYTGMLFCNLSGIASTLCINYESRASSDLQLASWFYFVSSWTFFIDRVQNSGFQDAPDFVQLIVVALPVFYGTFGFVGTTYHWAIRLSTLGNENELVNTKAQARYTTIACVAFDILSVVVKIMIAITVITGGSYGPGS
jgi:hypothetical protein